jgi:hypothetical protein
MAASATNVARPTLLWLVSTLAFGAALVAGLGFCTLTGARLAAPVTLVSETERLADALADAPWTASPENGPIVWAFTRPDCGDCGQFAPASVIALSDEEMEIRMTVVAARAETSASVAALAERRDWEALRAWTKGEAMTLQTPDPAAEEGYLEWGRASWDRVAAVLRENGVEPRLPLLIWRRGPEWRVLVGGGAASLDAVRRDMAVES